MTTQTRNQSSLYMEARHRYVKDFVEKEYPGYLVTEIEERAVSVWGRFLYYSDYRVTSFPNVHDDSSYRVFASKDKPATTVKVEIKVDFDGTRHIMSADFTYHA